MAALFAAALASVPLCGGRLAALGEVRLRSVWLLFAALAAQFVILAAFPRGRHDVHAAIHLATYAAIGAFAWRNRRVAGVALASLGGALNLTAIAANGGVMPARPGALRAAGLAGSSSAFENSAAVARPRLAWLGDWFAMPSSWPLANVFSVGDVVLGLGVLVALHMLCGTRPARRLG